MQTPFLNKFHDYVINVSHFVTSAKNSSSMIDEFHYMLMICEKYHCFNFLLAIVEKIVVDDLDGNVETILVFGKIDGALFASVYKI